MKHPSSIKIQEITIKIDQNSIQSVLI